jgi:hypothetical protein
MTPDQAIRKLAEEIAANEQADLYPLDTHAEKRARWEACLRAFLAEHGATALLGELAAKTEALGNLSATVRGECPRLLDEDSGGSTHLYLSIERALSGEAGKLASEVIQAVIEEQALEKALLCEPGEVAASGGLGPAHEAWSRRRAAVDALLAATGGERNG